MDDHCREALGDLQRYLDRECGADLEAAIRAHVGDCPPCFDRVEFEQQLRAIIATRCRDHAPAELIDRIVTSLRGSS